MAENKAGESDLNELLGSDSDGEVAGNKKEELNELLGSDDESDHAVPSSAPVPETKNEKSDLNELLGDSEDEDDYSQKKDDQKHIDDYFAKDDSAGRVDELEQILGKADTKPAAKEMKVKTRSKILMHPTYKVPSTDSTMFVRTPNFIKIQPTEYNEMFYEADQERKLFEGSTAVVRWRNKIDANGNVVLDKEGKPVRESNARMLRWSDGTVQLVVGDAIFQCKNLDVENCYIYEQQSVQVIPEDDTEVISTNNNVLECVSSVQKRLVLQPLSLDSESHARMSMKISEKFKKESKIRDRDYEQISEKPEKTLADLARQADEEDRRERRARERQYGSGAANTITGAARYIKRPTMSADYLAAGYDEFEDEEAEDDDHRSRQQHDKNGKKKSAPPPDYLEYDEDDGSEEEYDDDPDEEGEEVEDEEEEDEDDDEDEDEEDEVSGGDGEGSSDDDAPKKKSKETDGPKKHKKDKESRKARKQEKKDRKRRKEEKRAARREEKKQRKGDGDNKRKTSDEEVGAGAASSPSRSIGDEGDEDEEMNVQQRKRIKRTIIDSDDEE